MSRHELTEDVLERFKKACDDWGVDFDLQVIELLQTARHITDKTNILSEDDVVYEFYTFCDEKRGSIETPIELANIFVESQKDNFIASADGNLGFELLKKLEDRSKNIVQVKKIETNNNNNNNINMMMGEDGDTFNASTPQKTSQNVQQQQNDPFSTPKSRMVTSSGMMGSMMSDEQYDDLLSFDSTTGGSNTTNNRRPRGSYVNNPEDSRALFSASMNRLTNTPGSKRTHTPSRLSHLLATPSSSIIKENGKKGEVLFHHYATSDAIKKSKQVSATLTTTNNNDNDNMMNLNDDNNNNNEDNEVLLRKKNYTPVYVLSHILAEKDVVSQHAANTFLYRKHSLRNPQHPRYNSMIFPITYDNPFKQTTPFQFMGFDTDLSLNSIEKRDNLILEAIKNSTAFRKIMGDDIDDIVVQHDLSKQQMQSALYFGHIKNVLPPQQDEQGNLIPTSIQNLTQSTIVLTNYHSEVPLLLTHCNLQHYSLFPGQLILCRGTNVTGRHLMADIIFPQTVLAQYHRQGLLNVLHRRLYAVHLQKQREKALALKNSTLGAGGTTTTTTTAINKAKTADIFAKKKNIDDSDLQDAFGIKSIQQSKNNSDYLNPLAKNITEIPTIDQVLYLRKDKPVKVMYCNGPFVSPKQEVHAIGALLEAIKQDPENIPDVLLLSGPFVDENSVILQTYRKGKVIEQNSERFTVKNKEQRINEMNEDNNNGHISISTTTTTTTSSTTTTDQPTSLFNFPVYQTDTFIPLNPVNKEDEQDTQLLSYKDLFKQTLDHIISELNNNDLTRHITVITVPSHRDLHHYPTFPQPAYDYSYTPPQQNSSNSFYNIQSNNTVRVVNAPNPAMIDINGVVFGISTNDPMRDLNRVELHTEIAPNPLSSSSAPSSSSNSNINTSTTTTPNKSSTMVQLGSSNGNGPVLMNKKIVRLISHILSQQSFAPTTAVCAENPTENIQLESQAQTQVSIPFKPDVLIIPSVTRPFLEIVPTPGFLASNEAIHDPSKDFTDEHGHCIALNPKSAVENEKLGAFAMITLYNGEVNQNTPQEIDIKDRCSVEIIHL